MGSLEGEAAEAADQRELTEEEVEAAAVMDAQMQEALALNEKLRSMVLEMEAQPARGFAGAARPPRRAAPNPKSMTGAVMRAPREGQAGAGGWGGRTHTEAQAQAIDRHNAILVAKLSNIATRERRGPASAGHPHVQRKASSTVNRTRQETEIARENAKMAARLSKVKPTVGLSGKVAAKHAAEHEKYARIASRTGASAACGSSIGRAQPTSPIGALTGTPKSPYPSGCEVQSPSSSKSGRGMLRPHMINGLQY
ncbi:hypothetical protein AB1Y20_015336 [Prymnesium parvum]|uniref:Uncharacterized protein n=1 Tax=Prymnesium parvum TaxID=97485 RepID=A0AB34K090_PRYPA